MTALRLALSLVALVVAASFGVGAVSPSAGASLGSPFHAASASGNASHTPMGANVSEFMQASSAQTGGSVDNGMWVAAFEHASNATDRRHLVASRLDTLDAALASLQTDRQALQSAYRNGSINRSTYLAGLANLVGRLAAVGDGVNEADQHGQSVGVNRTRLDELRTRASELGGGAVSQLARNLTDDHEAPGQAGVFEGDHHGRAGDGSGHGSDHGANTTEHSGGHEGANGSSNQAGSSKGETGGQDTPTATTTATETGGNTTTDAATATATSSGEGSDT